MTSYNDPDRLHKVYMSLNTSFDGPDPGLNNLLELACVLHYESGEIIEEIDIKLKKVQNRCSDIATKKNFWDVYTVAWDWVNTDSLPVEAGMNLFYEFFTKHSKQYSIRFVGDPASRDFVWLQEYYTNYVCFAETKLFPYCRCLTTMRKSYQKMMGLTEDEILKLKIELQGGREISHIGIERARRQSKEFCSLRKLMYNFSNATHTLNNEKIINKIVTKLNLENLITNITNKIVETIDSDKLASSVASSVANKLLEDNTLSSKVQDNINGITTINEYILKNII